MSAASVVLVLANRGGHAPAPGYETIVIMALIAVMTIVSVLIAVHLRRRHRRPKPVADQWQALAVMGELCPYGWQAQITLYGWGAPVPADAPQSRAPLVELEWKQFDEEPGRVVVARRVWSPTIGEALASMVQDRRTDIALEEIEQAASEDGDISWGD
jgi:hypothetical protein